MYDKNGRIQRNVEFTKVIIFFSTTKRKKSVAQTNLDRAERLFQKTLDEALQMVTKTRKFYIRIICVGIGDDSFLSVKTQTNYWRSLWSIHRPILA